MIKACFLMPLWGQGFIDRYFDLVVHNHLSPGNVGAFRDTGSEFFWITDSPSKPLLEAKLQEFKHLFAGLNNSFGIVSQRATRVHPHQALSTCLRNGIHRKVTEFENLFFLNPDSVYADGSLKYAASCLLEGYRGVEVMTGVRTREELATPVLQEFLRARSHLNLSTNDLLEIAFKFEIDRKSMHCWPGYRIWDLGPTSKVVHSFALHPVAVNFNDGAFDFEGPADQLFLRTYLQDQEIKRLTSSKDYSYIDLCTQGNKGYATEEQYKDPYCYLEWYRSGWARNFHIDNFATAVELQWQKPGEPLVPVNSEAHQAYKTELGQILEVLKSPSARNALRYEMSFLYGRLNDSFKRAMHTFKERS